MNIARLAVLAVVAVLLFLANMTAQATSGLDDNYRRVVNIYDQGKRKSVITKAATVERALEAANVDIIEGDKVEPGLETNLEGDEFTINVYRAWPVMIVDGMRRERVLSIHTDPSDILSQSNINVRSEDGVRLEPTMNFIEEGVGASLYIERAIPVELVLYGESSTVYTRAKTVGDFIKQKNIKLEKDDTVSLEDDVKIAKNIKIEIWRNGVHTINEEQKIPRPVKTEKDETKDGTYKEVKVEGEDGSRTVTYEVTMQNGREISRKEIQSVVTKEPVERVEIVGTKFNYRGGPLSDVQIRSLGTCESGMTATRNSGNGFYGAFQFMPSTWRSVAPAEYKGVLPHEAPLEAQMQAVQNLLSRSNIYTQFPSCARKMQSQGVL